MKRTFVAFMMVLGITTQVNAQDIFGQVGPAAEQVMAEGLDGSPDTIARIIEIFNEHGIDLEVAPWEARQIVRESRMDRDRIGRVGLMAIGFMQRADTCADMRAKSQAAGRLSRGLMFASQLNAIGAGISLATGAGAAFAVPFGIASTVTGFASSWAGQLSSAYNQAASAAGCHDPVNLLEKPWTESPSETNRLRFLTRPQWRVVSGFSL